MVEFTHVIKDELGMHARPAGSLVKEVKHLGGKVTIAYNGKEVNALSIMALMTLGAACGAELTVRVEADNETEVAAALEQYLNENL